MHTPIGDMPVEMQVDGIETRASECGAVLARYIQLPSGVDFTPLFKGLPGVGRSSGNYALRERWCSTIRGDLHRQ